MTEIEQLRKDLDAALARIAILEYRVTQIPQPPWQMAPVWPASQPYMWPYTVTCGTTSGTTSTRNT